MSKTKRTRLNMPQTVAVAQWLTSHADECKQTTVRDICTRIVADTGITVSEQALRVMLQTCNIIPKRQPVSGDLTDRTGIVARAVIEMMQQLGVAVPDNLRLVALRRKIAD